MALTASGCRPTCRRRRRSLISWSATACGMPYSCEKIAMIVHIRCLMKCLGQDTWFGHSNFLHPFSRFTNR
ncbi:hypothetical protein PHJA_000473700 [Phtheirospermum japonicum]|uniref:Uncharacterized protein n=1 Tax=Phtheirospermum japonicum TaxID=374723 RepID=A0A830BGF8_9LAMI|nr:hypothetical protein PHJA_000473700 [Phtheirospermum japonicum]